MNRKQESEEQQELLYSHDHGDEVELTDLEDDEGLTSQHPPHVPHDRSLHASRWSPSSCSRHSNLVAYLVHLNPLSHIRRRHSNCARVAQLMLSLPYLIAALVAICGIFFPSYTDPPARYTALSKRVTQDSTHTGRANPQNEKVFIAASLYDPGGDLMSGAWGTAVAGLVDILGPENVYLSIYENDADNEARAALQKFEAGLTCNSSLVVEDLDLSQLSHVSTPDGKLRLKRIAFLAEVRNRALRPLEDEESPASHTQFDKLLYVNDVIFDPIDAANLLFSTNVDEVTGKTQYRAACAVDFINPVKFYDTFATRDMEGFSMGVPFYPWFTSAGAGMSRGDVLAQKDAVRVKSCWGGMVAFEAQWFQSSSITTTELQQDPSPPLRFRAENDTYWDASECCLVHADLTLRTPVPEGDTAIFMNPYIRVAYSSTTLRWLGVARRFERLYSPIHLFVNWLAARPGHNPRRLEQPGQVVTDRVWEWSAESQEAMREGRTTAGQDLQGAFREVQRVATPGSFCGGRNLLYINEDPSDGESKWGTFVVPADT